MGLVAVHFSHSNLSIRKLNVCRAFQFAPTTFAVHLSQPRQVPNRRFDGDLFNVANLAENFEFHIGECLGAGPIQVRRLADHLGIASGMVRLVRSRDRGALRPSHIQ